MCCIDYQTSCSHSYIILSFWLIDLSSFLQKKIENIHSTFPASFNSQHISPDSPPPSFPHLSTVTKDQVAQIITNSPSKSCSLDPWPTFLILDYLAILITSITRLGQLGANISPDRSSLTPQVLIGNFLFNPFVVCHKSWEKLYELQHINLLSLYLPKEDGVSPDVEYITQQITFSIFLQ